MVIADVEPGLWGYGAALVVCGVAAGAAAWADLVERRLPNRLVAVAAVASLVAVAFTDAAFSTVVVLWAANAGPLLILWLVAPGEVGGGDVKLAAALAPLGAWPPGGFPPLMLAAALLFAVPHALWARRRGTGVTFGPYLVAGAAVVMLSNLART